MTTYNDSFHPLFNSKPKNSFAIKNTEKYKKKIFKPKDLFPFGKYKGVEISQVYGEDLSYIRYLEKNGFKFNMSELFTVNFSSNSEIRLNTQQQEACTKIQRFLLSEDREFLLEGEAGTGKTTVIKYALSKKKGVIGCTVSHKAKIVLGKSLNWVNTIASLFNLRPSFDDEGNQIFNKLDENMITDSCKILVVDECSMISPELRKMILDYTYPDTKIIYLGDKCQTPYIDSNKPLDKDSPCFAVVPNHSLVTVMRNENNISLAKQLRNLILKYNEDQLPIDYKLDITETEDLKKLSTKEDIVEQFSWLIDKKNVNSVKLVAYKNSVVNSFNKEIREKIFNNPKTFEIGDWIMMRSEYVIDAKPKKIIYYNGMEFIISSITSSSYAGYKVTLLNKEIPVLKRESYNDWDSKCSFLKREAIKLSNKKKKLVKLNEETGEFDKDKATTEKDIKKLSQEVIDAWKLFYGHIDLFPKLQFGYCITSHLSTGSTYLNTICLESDIMEKHYKPKEDLKSIKEPLQLLYVACSRHKQKLFIG
jgi:hypothetical protein